MDRGPGVQVDRDGQATVLDVGRQLCLGTGLGDGALHIFRTKGNATGDTAPFADRTRRRTLTRELPMSMTNGMQSGWC